MVERIPQDPGYESKVRESFARQQHMATLGAAIEYLAPGAVDISLPFADRFCQQNGFMHAGAIASAADSANGYAAYTLSPPGTDVLAVEFKINLLAPARGPRFRFEGVVVKPGRTISVVDGRALQFDADGSGEKLIATMSATVMTVRGREALKH